MSHKLIHGAVVPGYYLVCYNVSAQTYPLRPAVVPGYYLVCYNLITVNTRFMLL